MAICSRGFFIFDRYIIAIYYYGFYH
ncbi:MAG: hypothetical protein DI588_02760 [Flavobacterium johnsoniae]|nr:MAG: hypothetical protein DI588_02760 [Flavobacterium johnsoniae]